MGGGFGREKLGKVVGTRGAHKESVSPLGRVKGLSDIRKKKKKQGGD